MHIDTHPHSTGLEFDQWLDWNGAAEDTSPTLTVPSLDSHGSTARSYYAISPASVSNGEFSPNAPPPFHTAPSSTGPLTPAHDSRSPEVFVGSNNRLSGDTLRDDASISRHSSLKRKLSDTAFPDAEEEKPGKGKHAGSKRPHNVIEKRYRANLNEKIAELRDSVPALRVLQKSRNKDEGNAGSEDEEDLDGLVPSSKLNKASILSKAVEYIRHLELRNRRLEDENKSLKDRVQTLDQVLAQGGNDAQRAAAFTTDNVIEQLPANPSDSSCASREDGPQKVEGRIPVPDEWKRMREQTRTEEHYGHVYANSDRTRLPGKWGSRIMLGTLAGLMVMEGFSETDHGTDSQAKGLFGIPLEILDGWTFLSSPRIYLRTFAAYYHAGGFVPLIKGFCALTILAFLVFSYLFNSKPHPAVDFEKQSQQEPQAARPASPIEVRRRAWSTSMQALRLPHHSFFPEWIAVTSEWLKYTLRWMIGSEAFAILTGSTSEDEIARVKAWDIAIDAQLAGGDIEVSRSRVLLTIFGSGTLPSTPMRLMQKALHCRVLLWNVGIPSTFLSTLANWAGTWFANRQWRMARQLHERLAARDADRLPGYLNYLLQMDCEEVFNDVVTQRASNLMYNRPTSEYSEDALMDVVVEDHAIRSPLDAIAAWRSTCALHEALNASFQSPDTPDILRSCIQAALEIAPPGSAAETRALAVHAVLSPGRRLAFYSKADEAMTSRAEVSHSEQNPAEASAPYFIDSSTPASARPEVAVCLLCAKIMLTLEQERDLAKAIALLSRSMDNQSPMSILTAATTYFALYRICRSASSDCGPPSCAPLAQTLTAFFSSEILACSERSDKLAIANDFLCQSFDCKAPCKTPSRRHSMISNDTGYASLSE